MIHAPPAPLARIPAPDAARPNLEHAHGGDYMGLYYGLMDLAAFHQAQVQLGRSG